MMRSAVGKVVTRYRPPQFKLPGRATLGRTICLLLLAGSSAIAQAEDKDFTFSLYGGSLTDSNWRDSLTGRADFVDSQLLVGALGWTFKRADNRDWSLELEGQAAKHFGDQTHWEFNALASARWHRFPWSDTMATSVAFGLGPSYATRLPATEVALDGSSHKLLLYWHLELTLGPPDADWTALLRLHHRSASYGVFSEDGGSNAVTVGVRFFF